MIPERSCPSGPPTAAARAAVEKIATVPGTCEHFNTHLLARFWDYYDLRGLIREGLPQPLHRACARCDRCWGPLDESARRDPGHPALPWVGSQYDKHRIVLLANNLRSDGELHDEAVVVQKVTDSLRAGKRSVGDHMGSTFGYGCARYASALRRYLAGEPILSDPAPEEVAGEMPYVARLQTVKCSPQGTKENQPTRKMSINCPEVYLLDELVILRPNIILAMGGYARERLGRVLGRPPVANEEMTPARVQGAPEFRAVGTYHPSRGLHRKGYTMLKDVLEHQ